MRSRAEQVALDDRRAGLVPPTCDQLVEGYVRERLTTAELAERYQLEKGGVIKAFEPGALQTSHYSGPTSQDQRRAGVENGNGGRVVQVQRADLVCILDSTRPMEQSSTP